MEGGVLFVVRRLMRVMESLGHSEEHANLFLLKESCCVHLENETRTCTIYPPRSRLIVVSLHLLYQLTNS